MQKLIDGMLSMMAVTIALVVMLTIFFPLALYACWLWKCLVAIYPKL